MSLRLCLVALAVVLAGSCSREQPAPATGSPAGEVVEVSGKVTAERGGVVRTLVVGTEVFADDVVATGDASSVVVLLRHNGARWQLGAGARERVDASLAWKVAPSSGPALAKKADDTTVTAGRNVENETAATADTLPRRPPPEPADEAPSTEGRKAAPRGAREQEKKSQKPVVGSKGRQPELTRRSGTGSAGDGSGNGSPSGSGSGSGSGGLPNADDILLSEASIAVAVSNVSVSPEQALATAAASARVARLKPVLRRCYRRALDARPALRGTLVVRLSVSKAGAVEKADVEADQELLGSMASCVRSAALALPVPVSEAATIRFEVNLGGK